MRDLVDGSRRSFSAAMSWTLPLRWSSAPRSPDRQLSGREHHYPDHRGIGGQPDFSSLTFTINNSEFRYGAFINSLISFLIIALVIYFLIVKPMNTLMARVAPTLKGQPAICPECFSEISPDANRCPNCTTWLRGPNVAVS